ncbi:fibroblast growth factor-binding protein 2-like [Sinocyclocheilus rhinocerous]|uniref:fibroblast growth factor-binding protein 2-like n=1 Tax=Sinocyclocheilus rhinocerous TaxID=307959 RepID=UPI0007BAB63F|nr:PREDICTED: fibroblast growth factor-binding protein 2-like [Sinocyclocheilus rhinocerous]
MWTITSTLLLTCCLRAALVQSQDHDDIKPGYKRNVWEDEIEFLTKGTRDECSLSVTGQGDLTKLRITCLGLERSYWCEYQGKPQVCRSYNNNPLHYFRQIMWDLRKLPNACQGQRVLKPLMCRRASDEAQMVFTSASSSDTKPMDRPYRPAPDRPMQMRPQQRRREQRPKPTRPQILRAQSARTAQDKPNQPKAVKSTKQKKITTPKPTMPRPTTPVPTSEAKKLAQDYCWRSFQGVCSFVIGWFRN